MPLRALRDEIVHLNKVIVKMRQEIGSLKRQNQNQADLLQVVLTSPCAKCNAPKEIVNE